MHYSKHGSLCAGCVFLHVVMARMLITQPASLVICLAGHAQALLWHNVLVVTLGSPCMPNLTPATLNVLEVLTVVSALYFISVGS